LMNAAIYTENLATRNPDVGDEEALSFEATVVDGVGGIADRENFAEYDTYGAVETNVTDGVETFNDQLRRTAVEQGVVASINVSTVTTTEGRLIRHTNDSESFTAADGTADWTLAENVTDVRNHTARVHKGQLAMTNASDAAADGAFHVLLDNGTGSDEWHAYVYENQTTSEIAVAVKPGDVSDPSNAMEVCSTAGPRATVDFTAGTIDGDDCPGLDWAESIPNGYDLEYVNGDAANGTYSVTAEGTDSILSNIGTVIVDDPSQSPRYVPAVYAVELTFSYRSPDLTYRTTVRVARGEPDG